MRQWRGTDANVTKTCSDVCSVVFRCMQVSPDSDCPISRVPGAQQGHAPLNGLTKERDGESPGLVFAICFSGRLSQSRNVDLLTSVLKPNFYKPRIKTGAKIWCSESRVRRTHTVALRRIRLHYLESLISSQIMIGEMVNGCSGKDGRFFPN